MGADEALNYKDKDIITNKYEFADCVFENVGGEQLDLNLSLMRPFGRIAFCGSISQYNSAQTDPIYNYPSIVRMRLRVQGFIVTDFAAEFPKALKEMGEWVQQGKLGQHYHLVEGGVAKTPEALASIFEGKNQGKTLVKL
jgi:NADPH-dependent curcumin reductase CurA